MTDHASKNPNLKMTTIIGCVCVAFDVTAEDFMGPRRFRDLVRARKAAAGLIRELREMSYPRIAKALNKHDHTSALHLVLRSADLVSRDPDFAARYREAMASSLECLANGLQWPRGLSFTDRAALSGQIIKRQPAVKFEAPAYIPPKPHAVRLMGDGERYDQETRIMIDRGTRQMAAMLAGAGE